MPDEAPLQFPYTPGHPYDDEVRGVAAVSVSPLLMMLHYSGTSRGDNRPPTPEDLPSTHPRKWPLLPPRSPFRLVPEKGTTLEVGCGEWDRHHNERLKQCGWAS